MKIRTRALTDISISRFRRLRSVVDFEPPYQREAGVWEKSTREMLIDTVINGLDMPKMYFETLNTSARNEHGLAYQYAVIDGKQRLEAINSFLNNELSLPEDFQFFEDRHVQASGLTLSQLEGRYPALAQRFYEFTLPIVGVTTDSGDLIEELFQRLNASSALNAAERRNAINSPTRTAANRLAEHPLLTVKSPIKNARYKYRELGAKFLAIENQLSQSGHVVDTKAKTLYRLFLATRGADASITSAEMANYQANAVCVLESMSDVFTENDPLLASIGTMVVYYLSFRDPTIASGVTREMLLAFESARRRASKMSEYDNEYLRPANARLREYASLVQSTNDGGALNRRSAILNGFIKGYQEHDALAGLDSLSDFEPMEFVEDAEGE